jgi:endonuclease YncB( thermonuclease family)
MERQWFCTLALTALTLTGAAEDAVTAAPEDVVVTAKVLSVQEGDLLTIQRPGQEPERVRLYGADAPEPEQAHFQDAFDFSRAKVEGLDVSVELVTTTTDGMPVVVLRTPGHENLSHELLKAGLAWWDEANTPADGTLKSLNAKAIGAGTGLWTDPAALAPWDYRKSHQGAEVVYASQVKKDDAPAEKAPVVLKAKGDPNMGSGATAASPEGNAPAGAPEALDIPKDIDYMALMTRHQPELTRDAAGNVVGLSAKDISQIPFASMLGFQDGDVLTSVNGTRLQSEGQIMGMVNQLKGQKNFQVEVLRNGQPTTLNIAIP